jgi:hypothetical protein
MFWENVAHDRQQKHSYAYTWNNWLNAIHAGTHVSREASSLNRASITVPTCVWQSSTSCWHGTNREPHATAAHNWPIGTDLCTHVWCARSIREYCRKYPALRLTSDPENAYWVRQKSRCSDEWMSNFNQALDGTSTPITEIWAHTHERTILQSNTVCSKRCERHYRVHPYHIPRAGWWNLHIHCIFQSNTNRTHSWLDQNSFDQRAKVGILDISCFTIFSCKTSLQPKTQGKTLVIMYFSVSKAPAQRHDCPIILGIFGKRVYVDFVSNYAVLLNSTTVYSPNVNDSTVFSRLLRSTVNR